MSSNKNQYRFVVIVDVEAEDLSKAYNLLREGMGRSFENEWESTDELYDEDGEPIDPDEFAQARMDAGRPFAASNGISMKCDRVEKRPDGMMDDRAMDHWRCVLRRGKRSMTTYYSMGSAYKGRQPTPDEVLISAAHDSRIYDFSSGFEDWAADYGVDIYDDQESKLARKTWGQIRKQRDALMKFLDDDLYTELLDIED